MPIAHPQKTRWGPANGREAGIFFMDNQDDLFIAWKDLRPEIEHNLLCQLGRHIPGGCTVRLDTFHERKDWLIRIVNREHKDVGYIWFGSDPEKNWQFDGLVRAGNALNDFEAEVWQVFQRYSDGSYCRIEARVPKSV
jgi:hypothetical protein